MKRKLRNMVAMGWNAAEQARSSTVEVYAEGLEERLAIFYNKQRHTITIQLFDENHNPLPMRILPSAENSVGIICREEDEGD